MNVIVIVICHCQSLIRLMLHSRDFFPYRPGLMDFLNEVRKIYELHIYTMGTRNYALAVANIIDPDEKIFGDRLITRDENGGSK